MAGLPSFDGVQHRRLGGIDVDAWMVAAVEVDHFDRAQLKLLLEGVFSDRLESLTKNETVEGVCASRAAPSRERLRAS
jgi:hypothetical protein